MENQEWMPRERLERFGADALSDAELLAVILRTGTHGTPVVEMAQKILQRFKGSLLHLCDATPKELSEIAGMGTAKSLELYAAFALARRLARQRLMERPKMNSPTVIADYIRGLVSDSQQEEFFALLLDTKMYLLHVERVSVGLVDRSLVHAREVFRRAIREASAAVILCHNHPSGIVRPSNADRRITQSLAFAGVIVGIRVVDHIIVAGKILEGQASYFSFLENKMMPDLTEFSKAMETEECQEAPQVST